YVLRAMGADKKVESRQIDVEVIEREVPQVRITRFAINPTAVHGMQLCYAVENARSARIDPEIGELNKLPADCPRISATRPTTYTLTATGEDGRSVQRSVSYQPPKPTAIKIISFTPQTQTINSGA